MRGTKFQEGGLPNAIHEQKYYHKSLNFSRVYEMHMQRLEEIKFFSKRHLKNTSPNTARNPISNCLVSQSMNFNESREQASKFFTSRILALEHKEMEKLG